MLKYVYRIEGGCVKNKIYYKSLFYVFLMVIYGILTYVFLWVGFNTKTKIRVDYQDIGDVYYDVKYVDAKLLEDEEIMARFIKENCESVSSSNNKVRVLKKPNN